MARIYRRHPDSSYLDAPRVFVRVFCRPDEIQRTVQFYETLTGAEVDMDQDIPELGLRVAAVGSFLILAREPADDLASQTSATVLNSDLDEAVERQLAAGAEIVQERWESIVGAGTRLRHPDGLLVEYLEHRPSKDDVPEPQPDLV